MSIYENYSLTRTISIREIVTADYFTGPFPSDFSHDHPDAWELCCCLQGEMQLVKDFRKVILGPGQVALVQPGTPHDVCVMGKRSANFVISFTCSGEQLRSVQDSVITYTDDQLVLFHKIVEELKNTFQPNDLQLHLISFRPSPDSPFGAEHMICNYLEQILITLLRNVTMKDDGTIVRSEHFKDAMQSYLVAQVGKYIQDNLHEKLTVEDIATHFHYSRARLSAIFKSVSEMGINEVVTFERMRKAKLLLTEGNMSVTQIAATLGYCSPQYFSTKFTKEVGCPPSQYAQLVKEGKIQK
ncbi:MAG: helix-turn-helix transcriptional regulator [Oscillospiraceae bacterium]|nr:helix-turn-helix transcriptional regulator [Oscillospiraceae bacterium]